MITISVILTIITAGLLGLVCYTFTSSDLFEKKFASILLLVAFSFSTTVAYMATVHLKDVAKQQEMAVMMGATPLTDSEVYNTSQAELNRLLKIGNVYYHIESTN